MMEVKDNGRGIPADHMDHIAQQYGTLTCCYVRIRPMI